MSSSFVSRGGSGVQSAAIKNVIVDLDTNTYSNLKALSERLKMKDKNKEKILLSRKSQLYEYWDLVNCENIRNNLTKLIGFFYLQQHLCQRYKHK